MGRRGKPKKRADGSRGPVSSQYPKDLRAVIGVDPSYKRTGLSIAVDGELKVVTSINFKHVQTKTGKRLLLQKTLRKAIESCLRHFNADQVTIITEQIRTFTGGGDLRPSVIKAASAMQAYIVDTGMEYGIKTWSVDTRVWKAAILGTSKPSIEFFPGVKNPKKILDVKHVIALGFEDDIKSYGRGNEVVYDDDAADSACIALYGFHKDQNLRIEQ